MHIHIAINKAETIDFCKAGLASHFPIRTSLDKFQILSGFSLYQFHYTLADYKSNF